MSARPEALRLADWIAGEACGGSNWNAHAAQTAAELRRLHADLARLRLLAKELIEANEAANVQRLLTTRQECAWRALAAEIADHNVRGEAPDPAPRP